MISLSPIDLKNTLVKIENTSEESCGFLLGTSNFEENRVDMFYHVKNISTGDRSKRYEISLEDYLLVEKFAIGRGLIILGVYHTHINHPAKPSELDKKFAFPDFFYLIISLVNYSFSELKCWKINSQRMFEEVIITFNR